MLHCVGCKLSELGAIVRRLCTVRAPNYKSVDQFKELIRVQHTSTQKSLYCVGCTSLQLGAIVLWLCTVLALNYKSLA
jgi:hypothetical protein